MQPAKAKPAPEPRRKGAAARARRLRRRPFTARELDAARQLIHLSESSASSGTTGARPIAAAAASGGSSPRSQRPSDAGRCIPWRLRGPGGRGGAGGSREPAEVEAVPRLIAEIYAADGGNRRP
ncbi:hypothetical protein D1007_43008 [Hordeum vulgare]|nr:hypothetical protein D1007_43008 [Hordeum vulgare]